MKSSKSEEISAFESLPHVSRRKFAKRAIIGALGSSILLESLPASWGDASPLPAFAPGADLPVRNITVDRVETFKVVVPMKPGTVLSENYERVPEIRASWDFESIPKFVIRLHASSGLVGLGETARGESELALAENSKFLPRRNILGLDFANAALGLPQVSTSDGFEIAIYDLIRKTLGVPVHVLLGGRFQDKIAVTYWTGQRIETDLVNVAGPPGSNFGFNSQFGTFPDPTYTQGSNLEAYRQNLFVHTEDRLRYRTALSAQISITDVYSGQTAAKLQEVFGSSTLSRGQLLSTFPFFPGGVSSKMYDGRSIYHGMNLRVQKRYSHGLDFIAAYTWSKKSPTPASAIWRAS